MNPIRYCLPIQPFSSRMWKCQSSTHHLTLLATSCPYGCVRITPHHSSPTHTRAFDPHPIKTIYQTPPPSSPEGDASPPAAAPKSSPTDSPPPARLILHRLFHKHLAIQLVPRRPGKQLHQRKLATTYESCATNNTARSQEYSAANHHSCRRVIDPWAEEG